MKVNYNRKPLVVTQPQEALERHINTLPLLHQVIYHMLNRLRVLELLDLNVSDIAPNKEWLIVNLRGRVRIIQMPPPCLQFLTEYIKHRAANPLFINGNGERLDLSGLWEITSKFGVYSEVLEGVRK